MDVTYFFLFLLFHQLFTSHGEKFYDVEDSDSNLQLISERDLFQGGDGPSEPLEPIEPFMGDSTPQKPRREDVRTVSKLSTVDDVVFSVLEPPKDKPSSNRMPLLPRHFPDFNVTNTTLANETAAAEAISNKSVAVECELREEHPEAPSVIIANSTLLQTVLVPSNETNVTVAACAVVLFFSSQCVFSARMAPHYNALARVFPGLPFYATDTSHHNSAHVRYGIVSVPNILLFHNAKPVSRFNDSQINLENLVSFVVKYTDLPYTGTLNVTSADMSGPVPASLSKRVDCVLIMAWAFTLFCLCFWFVKSSVCHKIVECIRNTWIEAEAQHEHTD